MVLHNWEQSSVEERIDDIEGRLINCRCSDFEHVKEDRLLCTRGGIALVRSKGGLPTVTRRKMVYMEM